MPLSRGHERAVWGHANHLLTPHSHACLKTCMPVPYAALQTAEFTLSLCSLPPARCKHSHYMPCRFSGVAAGAAKAGAAAALSKHKVAAAAPAARVGEHVKAQHGAKLHRKGSAGRKKVLPWLLDIMPTKAKELVRCMSLI